MPIYTHECSECKKEIEIIRSMAESDVPPEEASDDKCNSHKWIKVIKHAPTKKLGPNWGGGKGNWNSNDW